MLLVSKKKCVKLYHDIIHFWCFGEDSDLREDGSKFREFEILCKRLGMKTVNSWKLWNFVLTLLGMIRWEQMAFLGKP